MLVIRENTCFLNHGVMDGAAASCQPPPTAAMRLTVEASGADLEQDEAVAGGGAGLEQIGVADGAGAVLVFRDVFRRHGDVHGALFGGFLIHQGAQGDQGVFDLLEGGQHGLTVDGDGGVPVG